MTKAHKDGRAIFAEFLDGLSAPRISPELRNYFDAALRVHEANKPILAVMPRSDEIKQTERSDFAEHNTLNHAQQGI